MRSLTRPMLASGAALTMIASLASAASATPQAATDARTLAVLTGGSGGGHGDMQVEVASSRPDMVSGGSALIEVAVPRSTDPARVRVKLGRTDITAAFTWDADQRVLVGVVEELPEGRSRLTATAGRHHDSVTITNHPGEGPMFAGPHQEPFYCETEAFTIPVIEETLGEPVDADCSIETRVDYIYRTTEATYAVWPADAADYPDDLAWTTISTGDEVPFIVRMETGTANRGIYQHAVLHDPLTEAEPSPIERPEGWNGRIVYTLGGGCAGGWYRQGPSTGGVTDPILLEQGYAVVSNSLNVFGNNCNDLLASETAAMTKEVFIETYGRDEHTIALGCSGGSYQAHQTADNYPGIFDGIVVGCSFPEVGFGTINMITDARLLQHYFEGTETEWSAEQQRLVTGFANLATMDNVSDGAQRIDPRVFCGIVPEEEQYNPETNPGGVRCDVYDHTINVYGADPGTGFALRPLDNTGIQYGLGALRAGDISVEQFLDLNAEIGGYDGDASFASERTQADLAAVEAAYRSGRLTNGGLGLATTPIVDYRAYMDDVENGDIHVRYHTSSMRERLVAANGHAGNYVSLLEDDRYGLFGTTSPLLQHGIEQMDSWLTALDLGDDRYPSSREVVRAKPVALVDGCMTRDEDPEFLAMPLDRDPTSECEQLYPSASFPREVAGEDVAADTIVCAKTEPERTEYPEMTEAQWSQLLEVFADGVCDYDQSGIAQSEPDGVWQRF